MIPAVTTAGGLGIALVILLLNLRPWWKSNDRDPRLLVPFSGGFALGALSTLCAGGALGLLATWIAHITNKAGQHAVPGATGQPEGSMAHGDMGRLTAGGGLTTFFLACVMVAAWRATGKGDAGRTLRRRMAGGVLCGVALALTVGVAGLLQGTLVAGANGIGDQVLAAFNHKASL